MKSELGLELMEFAAFATIGDVMELRDENRIIVKSGLTLMKNTRNLGLKALMDATGTEPENIKPYTIGFVLGPCLNATGRLDSAVSALELFQAKDRATAATIGIGMKRLSKVLLSAACFSLRNGNGKANPAGSHSLMDLLMPKKFAAEILRCLSPSRSRMAVALHPLRLRVL